MIISKYSDLIVEDSTEGGDGYDQTGEWRSLIKETAQCSVQIIVATQK